MSLGWYEPVLCGKLEHPEASSAFHFPHSHFVGDISSLLCSSSLEAASSQGPGYVFRVVQGKKRKKRALSSVPLNLGLALQFYSED